MREDGRGAGIRSGRTAKDRQHAVTGDHDASCVKSAGVGSGDGDSEVGLSMSPGDDLRGFFRLIHDREELKFLGIDIALGQHFLAQPCHQATPVLAADQDDREPGDLPGGDQRQRLEQLIESVRRTRHSLHAVRKAVS
jgi:hypothetical protein